MEMVCYCLIASNVVWMLGCLNQGKLNRVYKRFYKQTLKDNNELMIYCISKVKEKYLSDEDYESVIRCEQSLIKLREWRKEYDDKK